MGDRDDDGRHGPNTVPANKLSDAERTKVVAIATSAEFRDQPPSQIVPRLADRGEYVASHQHSGIGFVTPGDRHAADDVAPLAARRAVYAEARVRHPERWAGDARPWKRPDTVTLNPEVRTTSTTCN